MLKPFTAEQKFYIDSGTKNAERLGLIVAHALGAKKKLVEVKRHTYIYSPPGAGKTFTVAAEAAKNNIKMIQIQGTSSMNAFVIKLAFAVYSRPKGDIIVWVDDCDSLFMDLDDLNVMKGALDEERNVIAWGKNMTGQISSLEKSTEPNDNLRAEALRAFQQVGEVGLEIPTDRVRFIITSNKNLCPPADIFTRKGNKKLNMQEGAIRDRVNYEEFELDSNQSWGWVASTVLNNNVLDLTDDQKQILLDWLWTNWVKLPANSMRAVKDFAAMMLNHPNDYPDYWASMLRK